MTSLEKTTYNETGTSNPIFSYSGAELQMILNLAEEHVISKLKEIIPLSTKSIKEFLDNL